MTFKEILIQLLKWRFSILLIAIVAMFFVSPRTGFTDLTPTPSVANLSVMWSNFDGLHYLDLAKYGYGYQHKTDMDYAFFPLYPLAIRYLNIFGSYLASGLIWSHVFFAIALYFLYKLIRIDESEKIARSSLLLLLIFPASFFFGSIYTESLFLLLTVLSFYFARKKNFLFAGIFAALASATRITGVFIWPSLVYEFWLTHGKNLKNFISKQALTLLIPPLGILAFIRFQAIRASDPFFFINIQSNFTGRGTDKLILLYQVFFRYAKMVIFVDHSDPLFFTVLFELFSALLVLFVLFFSFKKIRFSYWLFILLSYILPTFTGTFMSMPRFTIVLFPVFIYLSRMFDRQHPFIRIIYYLLCVVFTIFAVTFFTRGYFVG